MPEESITCTPTEADKPTLMLSAESLATHLDCSPRSIYRLVDEGRIPPPVKIGRLSRWPRSAIANWIEAGCPPYRN